MTDDETEKLTAFVRLYASVEEGEEARSGYFAFCAGASSRSARKARQPIQLVDGEPIERLIAKVLRRAGEVAASGEGHVFVRFYFTGATDGFEDQVKIEGAKASDQDEIEAGGSAVSAAVQALVLTNRLLVEDGRELRRTIAGQQGTLLEYTERLAMTLTHALYAEQALTDNQMAEAMKALGPTFEKLAPKMADAFGTWLGASQSLPSKPSERINVALARIVALTQEIAKTMQEHPKEVPADTAEKIKQLLDVYAETIGMKVVPK